MWQPIETAPKDGSDSMLLKPHRHPDDYRAAVTQGWWDEGFGAWLDWNDDDGEDFRRIHPTHWMPLPSPPAIQHDSQRGSEQHD